MAKTQSKKDWDLMVKKEMDMIKREDRQENVERISKAQGYKKDKIMEKINFDNMKTVHVRNEKQKLLETRFQVRREAEKQKTSIMEAFELMRKKGKIDNSSLKRLGLTVEIKEDPNEDDAQRADLQLVSKRQNKEMKNLLESELKSEQKRESKISQTKDDDEKTRLQKENDMAKAVSSDKISQLQANHEAEIRQLRS